VGRQELAEKGIRVNVVAPGPIWTPLIPATMPTERAESHGEKAPLGRAGQPAEVAPAYVFFASQESSYITRGDAGGHRRHAHQVAPTSVWRMGNRGS
jgi:NAD(P)-dependent dehydrogenase (short-subunit alcohol dehydrogenase family)